MCWRPNHCPTCGEPHRNAFCAECFQPRHASGGRASERMLKCSNCEAPTLHVVWGCDVNQNDRHDLGDALFWHPDVPSTHVRPREWDR